MSNTYVRINLEKTSYHPLINAKVIVDPPVKKLLDIYEQYCDYKQFESPYPFYPEHFGKADTELIGYYDGGELIAWSYYFIVNKHTVESLQFAWDYQRPDYRLGIMSMKHECWYYKSKGYKQILLGEYDEYKEQFDGYEKVGRRLVAST